MSADQSRDEVLHEALVALNLARIVLKNRDRGETEERVYQQIRHVIAKADSLTESASQKD